MARRMYIIGSIYFSIYIYIYSLDTKSQQVQLWIWYFLIFSIDNKIALYYNWGNKIWG